VSRAPCPHCDSFVERADLVSCYVMCNDCGARGPIVTQESDDEETPGKKGAVIAWNCRRPIAIEMAVAEAKAWDSLARYKFQMHGYWAGLWVHLNRIGGLKKPNPFKSLVLAARESGPVRARASDDRSASARQPTITAPETAP
jgi:hypothetical protein